MNRSAQICVARYGETDWNTAAPFEQGESMDACATRVLPAVMDNAGQNAGERILVITHA